MVLTVSSSSCKKTQIVFLLVPELPNTPSSFKAMPAGPESIMLMWAAPANTGAPVTGYSLVIEMPAVGVSFQLDGQQRTFMINNLGLKGKWSIYKICVRDAGRG